MTASQRLGADHSPEHVPVLIVGGSLVGLTLAALLAQYGIRCLVVEKHSSTAIYPKATVMMPRSMQVFKELGLYETMLRESRKYYDEKTCIVTIESLAGRLLNTWLEDVNEARDSRCRGIEKVSATRRVFLTQQALEPLLRARAIELGAEIRFSTELLDFSQSDDGVLATIRDRDTLQSGRIRSDYMIACDGFRSAIRTKLGIPMHGPGLLSRALTIYFEILDRDALARLPNAHHSGVIYVANRAVRAFFRFDRTKTESFLVINSAGPEGTEESRFPADAVTEDRAKEYLMAAIGDESIGFRVRSWTTWEAVSAFPDRLRQGSVFLAGDAAHQMPPSGGFGGNTGIQDAQNLAFKLAYVLTGQAGPRLLDSYEEERLPLARLTVLNALAHYVHRTEPALRDLLTEHHVREVPVEHLELAYRYVSRALFSSGSVSRDDEELVEDPATAVARPGSVAHHVLVTPANGPSTTVPISDFFGRSFVLLVDDDGPQVWGAAFKDVEREMRVPVKLVSLVFEASTAFRQRYDVEQDGVVLVRPDGFVAWSCASLGANGRGDCRAVLRGVFERVLCLTS